MGVFQRRNIAVAVAMLAVLALAIPALAQPDRASVVISRTCQVGSSSLPAGNYRVVFDGNKVSFLRSGKVVAEANGEWKKTPQKTLDTSVIYEASGRIIEIHVEGRDSYFALQ